MPDDGISIPRIGASPYGVIPNVRGPDPLSAADEVRPAGPVRPTVAAYRESGGVLVPTLERARFRDAAPTIAAAQPPLPGLGERIDLYA